MTRLYVNKAKVKRGEHARGAGLVVSLLKASVTGRKQTSTKPWCLASRNGHENGTVLWPLRIALTGQMSTPGGAIEIAYLLGREETFRRLMSAMDQLTA